MFPLIFDRTTISSRARLHLEGCGSQGRMLLVQEEPVPDNFFTQIADGWESASLFSLQVSSSLVISLSYIIISVALLYFARSRKDMGLRQVLGLFALLFFCASLVHLIESLNAWKQYPLFEDIVKGSTAIIAVFVAVLLWKWMPLALKLPNQADLDKINQALSRTENDLSAAIVLLEEHVEERTRELELLSLTDVLTDISNRRGILKRLEDELQRSQRYHQDLSVLMVDLDNFKAINDEHGHHIGDAVLVETARCITELCRAIDMVGRVGGEEFLIVLPATSAEDAVKLGKRICAEIAALDVAAGNLVIHFSCSIGAAQCDAEDDIDSITRRADKALYEAKESGKNRVILGEIA